jgi:hypothetical protein
MVASSAILHRSSWRAIFISTMQTGRSWGDYTKVTYLHAKSEQIRYNASRGYL